jgi:hypothetical protein
MVFEELRRRGLIIGKIDDTTTVSEYIARGLNYKELKNYIEFKINMEEIKDGVKTLYPYDFRKCTL